MDCEANGTLIEYIFIGKAWHCSQNKETLLLAVANFFRSIRHERVVVFSRVTVYLSRRFIVIVR